MTRGGRQEPKTTNGKATESTQTWSNMSRLSGPETKKWQCVGRELFRPRQPFRPQATTEVRDAHGASGWTHAAMGLENAGEASWETPLAEPC